MVLSMSKRHADFNTSGHSSTKKTKFDSELDDLWGADPDIEDVEDCIILASQTCSQANQSVNVSILPSYSAFKDVPGFSSTQADPNTTFKRPFDVFAAPANDLSSQLVEKLRKELETKDGEVSILRSKLTSVQTNVEQAAAQREKEIREKQTKIQQQLHSYKSELDFKNLEITNLKQKLSSLNKIRINATQCSTFNGNHTIACTSTVEKKAGNILTHKSCSLFDPAFFLCVDPKLFNVAVREVYIPPLPSTQMKGNPISLSNNDDAVVQMKTPSVKMTMVSDKSFLSCHHIYPDIVAICNTKGLNLNSYDNIAHINKIMIVLNEFLKNILLFQQELFDNMRQELIEKLNSMFLESKFSFSSEYISPCDSREWCENELGISARKLISFLGLLVPYNSYMVSVLIENNALTGSCSVLNIKSSSTPYNILQQLLDILVLIGKTKTSYLYPGFISSVVILIGQLSAIPDTSDQFTKMLFSILKSTITCKPTANVLRFIAKVLRDLQNDRLLNLFCKMPANNGIEKRPTTTFVLVSNDCCILQIFAFLYTNDILKRNRLKDSSSCDYNVLEFIHNLFLHNVVWIHSTSKEHYECICALCKLAIRIMVKYLSKWSGNKTEGCEFVENIVYVSNQLIHIFKFQALALIQSNVEIFSELHKVLDILECNSQLGDKDTESQHKIKNDHESTSEHEEDISPIKFEHKIWKLQM